MNVKEIAMRLCQEQFGQSVHPRFVEVVEKIVRAAMMEAYRDADTLCYGHGSYISARIIERIAELTNG